MGKYTQLINETSTLNISQTITNINKNSDNFTDNVDESIREEEKIKNESNSQINKQISKMNDNKDENIEVEIKNESNSQNNQQISKTNDTKEENIEEELKIDSISLINKQISNYTKEETKNDKEVDEKTYIFEKKVFKIFNKILVITKNCPQNCSNNGLCLNSTCFCSKNYTSSDCSVKYFEFEDDQGYTSSEIKYTFIILFFMSLILTALINKVYRSNESATLKDHIII